MPDVGKAIEESACLLEIRVLKDEWKFAATTFIQGKDTFISLPTGYGKSLIRECSSNLYLELIIAFPFV